MTNCDALPSVKLFERRERLIISLKNITGNSLSAKDAVVQVLLCVLRIPFLENKIKVICVTSETDSQSCPDQPAIDLNSTECRRLSKQLCWSFRSQSPNKGKWDSHHTVYVLFILSVHVFHYKGRKTVFKLHLKIRVQSKTPNPIPIFMLVRSLQKAKAE